MPVMPRKPRNPREIELDFIRGIAILMVLDFHAPHPVLSLPFLALGFQPFGWAGVDIFFVLSGFLVGGLLMKEWLLRGKVNSRQFLIRRGFKIWPQYYCFLLIMLLTRHRTLRELTGNLLNIQNYTGGVAHTWTLAVEEHAYLLLVLILALAAHLRMRARPVFALLVTLAAAILVNRFVLTAHGFTTFTRTDTRLDGILYGVMLALVYHFAPLKFTRLQNLRWLWVSILAATLVLLRFCPQFWWTPSLSWLAADMSGVAILLLLYRPREGAERPLLYRAIAAIGLYSYGIYLWHVSVIAPTMDLSSKLPPILVPWWNTLAPCFFGIAIGVIFTKLVEFPALKLRERLLPRPVDSAVGTPAEIEQQQMAAEPAIALPSAAQKTVP